MYQYSQLHIIHTVYKSNTNSTVLASVSTHNHTILLNDVSRFFVPAPFGNQSPFFFLSCFMCKSLCFTFVHR